MIQVVPCRKEDRDRWDEFVDCTVEGTLFHKQVWKDIIDRTFGYRAMYLMAVEDEEIVGVLPLYHLKSVFVGNALISTPFAVYGGIIASKPAACEALLAGARASAVELGASYVELRQLHALEADTLQKRDSLYVTFLQALPPSQDVLFSSLPREARRMIRRATERGLEARLTDDLNTFYDIYALSVRNLGTPVFPRRLFRNCLELMGDNADLLIVYYKGKAIAGVLTFYYKNTALPYYGGSIPEANHLGPNNFMYWKLMGHALDRGCTQFDFGRSKNCTGAFNFKRHMGFEPTPLPYQYMMLNGREIPNLNPTNPKFKFAITIWRKLPLGLTKAIGPRLVREFP